jgi:hypothetical protein
MSRAAWPACAACVAGPTCSRLGFRCTTLFAIRYHLSSGVIGTNVVPDKPGYDSCSRPSLCPSPWESQGIPTSGTGNLSEFPGTLPARQHDSVPFRGATLSAAAHGTPTGAAFDLVLILHVGFMLVGLASVLATGIQAWRARRGPDAASAPSVARFFRPGINWPGRSLYLVLVLGLVLVEMSRGSYDFSNPFVQIGLILWIVAISLAEMVVWPGERQLQGIVSGGRDVRADGVVAAGSGWVSTDQTTGIALRVALTAWTVCVVFVVATVVMVAKPG